MAVAEPCGGSQRRKLRGMQTKWRAGAVALGVGILSMPAQAAFADEVITTPAPPGASEAVALNVLDIVAIGHTQAGADGSSGEAKANALELGGDAPDAVFGGTQKGKGKQNGAFLDTGETPLGQLMLTPWSAEVDVAGDKRSADSDAALARLILIDTGTLTLDVLRTKSHAEHNGQQSKANTSSDGANLNLGDGSLNVILLHSETSSEANGTSSYVVGINGNNILTSDDAGGSCAISVPGVVDLGCLNAAGGVGSSVASVADGTVLGSRAAVVAGSSTFGSAPAAVLPLDITREPAAPAGELGAGPLARTGGSNVLGGVALGMTLIMVGGMALATARKETQPVLG